MIILSKSID